MHCILVVDDEENIRELLQAILTGEGYDVMLASSGAEALQLLSSGGNALMLTDLQMEDMSGLNLLEAMRVRNYTIPRLVMTGYSGKKGAELEIDARALGAIGFITKPFDTGVLLETIAKSLLSPTAAAQDACVNY